MASNPKYYIVEAAALPEVFLKVAEAKRLISTGEVATVNEAARITGISRRFCDALPQHDDRSYSDLPVEAP